MRKAGSNAFQGELRHVFSRLSRWNTGAWAFYIRAGETDKINVGGCAKELQRVRVREVCFRAIDQVLHW